jgi:hypothetical protein
VKDCKNQGATVKTIPLFKNDLGTDTSARPII